MPPSRSKPRKTRKQPLASTTTPTPAPSISRAAAQARISEFHTALKRKRATAGAAAAKGDGSASNTGRKEAEGVEDGIDHEALDAYQKLSRAGQGKQRGGDSSKVLIPWLQQCRAAVTADGPKLKMLEIGAVQHDNYALHTSWIDNSPIDLHSQHPDILQQDFFQRPIPTTSEARFDIISCSLVLNFVGEPFQRGQMLRLIHQHLEPRSDSLLFLVLPLPCLENSRYLTRQVLVDMMADIGFELLKERFKASGKVGYWLWGWRRPREIPRGKWSKKVVVNEGKKRNNFTILLADHDA